MSNTNSKSAGGQRFNYFLEQLQAALTKSEITENPALSLYEQNVRTPIFMLEALARIYKNLHDKKLFEKLNEDFKVFEDMLGAVDYYDGFDKEFSTNEKIPGAITGFIQHQKENKLADLNIMLGERSWIGNDNKRIKKIAERLSKADWLSEEDDTIGIKNLYIESINKANESFQKDKIAFKDVEGDVHELRRELRWVSIYPQALRGLIQMKPPVYSPEYLKKYLVSEIVNSPYNKMPEQGSLQNIIYVDADYFYALSWLIAELGKLKDSGLRIVILKEALQSTNKLNDEEAEKQALALCGEGQMKTRDILQKAKAISDQFFKEKNLEHLVVKQ